MLPSLFLSHGAPTLALERSPAGQFLDSLGTALPRPRAIVVASAHYLSPQAAAGAAGTPRTIHDFSGFPQALHELQYPAPGAPRLAEEILRRWRAAGLEPRTEATRGLDHGVWVPLLRMFPAAEIPVVPVAVDPRADARAHFRIGRALAGLGDEGVLVIGSGGFVHSLGDLDWRDAQAPMAGWAAEFADWMHARLLERDLDALLDWSQRAPHAARAHPTVEHLMPLFVALGAASADGMAPSARRLHRSHQFASLALDAYAFGG
jgi:4,5-DOPA dioxygenase extradiol